MAEDQDQETAAALAKLAEQDPAAAEDAQAALEWIAGEQGLEFITQERIQYFCWYQLSVKWFVEIQRRTRAHLHAISTPSAHGLQTAAACMGSSR